MTTVLRIITLPHRSLVLRAVCITALILMSKLTASASHLLVTAHHLVCTTFTCRIRADIKIRNTLKYHHIMIHILYGYLRVKNCVVSKIFGRLMHAKRFICCALIIWYIIYSMVAQVLYLTLAAYLPSALLHRAKDLSIYLYKQCSPSQTDTKHDPLIDSYNHLKESSALQALRTPNIIV